MFRLGEGPGLMPCIDAGFKRLIWPGASSRGCSYAGRFMELIMFGTKSERVALSNGPGGFKD